MLTMQWMKARLFLGIILILGAITASVSAGDITLNINSGSDSTVWFISGEPSLVMNGFDLTNLNLTFPAAIDRVSIGVNNPVPGASIDLVIYEDPNGGSPIDARLVSQTQVNITESGTFTYVFSEPVSINAPVVWIGFYLPVDFRFLADTSGPSVLTYWAWTPDGRFNLGDLRSAQILGPADGSAPVNINMNGKARITAEISSVGHTQAVLPGTTTSQQAGGQADLSVMRPYPIPCETLYYDTEDIRVIYNNALSFNCSLSWRGYAPPNPTGYERRELLYEITVFDSNGNVLLPGDMRQPVTHCIQPNEDDLTRAVVGIAYGAPRTWEILATMRFGNLVCAEVLKGGFLSYFVPA
jgi:hypothetical protein